MKLKNEYDIEYKNNVISEEAKSFLVKWHYSQSYRSLMQKHVFHLKKDNTLKGVAVYGVPVSRNAVNKYGQNTLELRRLCLTDDCPKNSESFFIGNTIRHLKKETIIENIVSYADPNVGHEGIIYKASNFKYLGRTNNSNPTIILGPDKLYHLREMYQKKNGEYTKSAIKIQDMVKKGIAEKLPQLNKHIYLYNIKRS